MTFDYANGEEAKYMVFIYRGFCNDRLYFSNYRDAKRAFDDCKGREKDASISLYKMPTDERKEFVKV